MAQADTNLASLRHSLETTWGETPSGPAMTESRYTSESIRHQKATVVSREVRSDRQRADVLEVGQSAAGDIGFELVYGDWESFFQSALASTIASAIESQASVTFAASAVTFSAGTDVTTKFKVGQNIRFGGGLTGIAKLATVSATGFTVQGTTLTASTVSATVWGRMLRNGVTKRSHLIEVNFTDITAVKYGTGMRITNCTLNAQANQIVTGTFSFMGKKGFTASTTVASTVTSASNNTPMTAAANVGTIFENSIPFSTTILSFGMQVANNLRSQPQVGSKPAAGIGYGGVDVTGNLQLYFEDINTYQKIHNHTVSDLSFRFTDASTNVMIVTIPSLYYVTGDPVVTGVDADVFVPMAWTARRDPTTGCTVQMDFLGVTP